MGATQDGGTRERGPKSPDGELPEPVADFMTVKSAFAVLNYWDAGVDLSP